MATGEPNELAVKLENYVLQLRQVEAALEVDPAHVELLKIKADLNELIDITKNLLSAKLGKDDPPAKRLKLSPESTSSSQTVSSGVDESSNLTTECSKSENPVQESSTDSESPISEGTGQPDNLTFEDNDDDKGPEEKPAEQPSSSTTDVTEPESSKPKPTEKTDEKELPPEEDKDPLSLSVVAYDKDGNRFTLADYNNRKVTDKKLINYFAKHKKRLNQICINDHRTMHGLPPVRFQRNRGLKSKKKSLKYLGRGEESSS